MPTPPPPKPWLLLDAEQERPAIPARARIAKAIRPPRRCTHGLSIYQECADCNDAARTICGA